MVVCCRLILMYTYLLYILCMCLVLFHNARPLNKAWILDSCFEEPVCSGWHTVVHFVFIVAMQSRLAKKRVEAASAAAPVMIAPQIVPQAVPQTAPVQQAPVQGEICFWGFTRLLFGWIRCCVLWCIMWSYFLLDNILQRRLFGRIFFEDLSCESLHEHYDPPSVPKFLQPNPAKSRAVIIISWVMSMAQNSCLVSDGNGCVQLEVNVLARSRLYSVLVAGNCLHTMLLGSCSFSCACIARGSCRRARLFEKPWLCL